MPEAALQFAQPLWLWGLLAIPLVVAWLALSSPLRQQGREAKYADAHLLPFLTGVAAQRTNRRLGPLIAWALTWTLLCLAMAGPRWDFRQLNPFEPGADLVILLDLSRSMDIADVNPSRLVRARQEIQDLVNANPGYGIGLVAFASVAHVVAPVTDDRENLLRQLPALTTGLTRLQGSRLAGALELAERLLAGQRDETAHNVLLISDGDFAEPDLTEQVGALRKRGIRLHVLAVGTEQGGPVPGLMATGGEPILSGLDAQGLQGLAAAGGGQYRLADYRDRDTRAILDAIGTDAEARQNTRVETQVWNEYYVWLLIPAVLMLLYLYRPGAGLARTPRPGATPR